MKNRNSLFQVYCVTVGRKSFIESTSGHYLQQKISRSFQGLERSSWLQSTCCPPLSFNLSLLLSVSLHPVPWLFIQWEMEQDWPLMTSSEWRAVHRSHCCARTLIIYWEHGHFTKENHLLFTHVSPSYTLHFGLLQLTSTLFCSESVEEGISLLKTMMEHERQKQRNIL